MQYGLNNSSPVSLAGILAYQPMKYDPYKYFLTAQRATMLSINTTNTSNQLLGLGLSVSVYVDVWCDVLRAPQGIGNF